MKKMHTFCGAFMFYSKSSITRGLFLLCYSKYIQSLKGGIQVVSNYYCFHGNWTIHDSWNNYGNWSLANWPLCIGSFSKVFGLLWFFHLSHWVLFFTCSNITCVFGMENMAIGVISSKMEAFLKSQWPYWHFSAWVHIASSFTLFIHSNFWSLLILRCLCKCNFFGRNTIIPRCFW